MTIVNATLMIASEVTSVVICQGFIKVKVKPEAGGVGVVKEMVSELLRERGMSVFSEVNSTNQHIDSDNWRWSPDQHVACRRSTWEKVEKREKVQEMLHWKCEHWQGFGAQLGLRLWTKSWLCLKQQVEDERW